MGSADGIWWRGKYGIGMEKRGGGIDALSLGEKSGRDWRK